MGTAEVKTSSIILDKTLTIIDYFTSKMPMRRVREATKMDCKRTGIPFRPCPYPLMKRKAAGARFHGRR